MMKKNIESSQILSDNLFPVVGIGASAGGLEAFKKLLAAIPQDSGMAYVLVQHLDPNHESMLAELLQRVTAIPVLEITDEIKVERDHVYIIPSNKMLVANDGVLQLSPREPKNNKKRNYPIDLFFTSLAEIHQTHSIGVVLSGTASDGTQGLKAIKDHGGITFAQDEASATFPDMPLNAVQAGVVDFILPPGEIPKKLLEINKKINPSDEELQHVPPQDEEVFKQILALLRVRKGNDFTYYKQTTIRRRILRRMALNRNENLGGYILYLRENKAEQDLLYQDLLIPVTGFFRDKKVFENLCDSVFPHISKSETSIEPVRIWVAGCSTGEEVYSMAICFKEFLGMKQEKVQIFATDISEPAIEKARGGIYSKSEVDGVSLERLEEFFSRSNGHYRVVKQIRDMCVFASHNFLKDPPFGKMDFISCRNVLIYMEPYLQKKALTTFHYALNPGKFLLLGKSETTSSTPDLFASVSKSEKLFTRKDSHAKFVHVASPRNEKDLTELNIDPKLETLSTDFQKTADDIMLSRYTPPGVVVNEAMEIVHFRGSTGIYLEASPGKPSHNLMKMAKGGLAFELRNILHKAKKENAAVTKENIPVDTRGGSSLITLEAIPLPNVIEPHYLLLFHDDTSAGNKQTSIDQKSAKGAKSKKDKKDDRIGQLENDLAQTREDMRGITEDQEASNEELQSANEELLSTSEELQSLNEELETSQEELQTTNEELSVVNQELIGLNTHITEARDYAEAIVTTIRTPLIVLNKKLIVITANPSFYNTFQVNESETQGKLIYELGNKQWNIPALQNLLEEVLPKKTSLNDFEVTHTFLNIGERVMLLNAREINREKPGEKMILLAIEDVTEQENAKKQIEQSLLNEQQIRKRLEISEAEFRQIAELMPDKITNADEFGNVHYFNQAWTSFTGLPLEDLKNGGWAKVMHPDQRNEMNKCWLESVETGNNFEMEIQILEYTGEYKWHLSRAVPVKGDGGKIIKWIGAATEMQVQKEQKQKLEAAVKQRTFELELASESLQQKNIELKKMNQELEAFTYVSSHDLQEPLRKIQTFANRILGKEYDMLSDAGKDYFKRMQSAASRMQTLIEDLLAYSRTNITDRQFENTPVNDIVEQVKKDLAETIQEKKAIIEAGDLGKAMINASQFRQVINNLLGNALKFSKPGQPPHITLKSNTVKGADILVETTSLQGGIVQPQKTYYHLSISDNGIGFDPKYGDQIFEVFQRLHGKEEYPGTGIGLAIVKKIIGNHDGIISATGRSNKGASFNIYIPE